MVNGIKTIPLFFLSSANGTAATEFRGDLIIGGFNKPLSLPSSVAGAPPTSQNAPKAFLGESIMHYDYYHNYDRKWELDLISPQYSFRPPRIFRFSLIECYQMVE